MKIQLSKSKKIAIAVAAVVAACAITVFALFAGVPHTRRTAGKRIGFQRYRVRRRSGRGEDYRCKLGIRQRIFRDLFYGARHGRRGDIRLV